MQAVKHDGKKLYLESYCSGWQKILSRILHALTHRHPNPSAHTHTHTLHHPPEGCGQATLHDGTKLGGHLAEQPSLCVCVCVCALKECSHCIVLQTLQADIDRQAKGCVCADINQSLGRGGVQGLGNGQHCSTKKEKNYYVGTTHAAE